MSLAFPAIESKMKCYLGKGVVDTIEVNQDIEFENEVNEMTSEGNNIQESLPLSSVIVLT